MHMSSRTSELGVVALWTGELYALQPFRIPDDGLVLGRNVLTASLDREMGRQHARLDRIAYDHLSVTDLSSVNGTFVGGEALASDGATVRKLAVIRTGRTVWTVDDVDEPVAVDVCKRAVAAIRVVNIDLRIHVSAIEATMLLFQRSMDRARVIDVARDAAKERSAIGGSLRYRDILVATRRDASHANIDRVFARVSARASPR